MSYSLKTKGQLKQIRDDRLAKQNKLDDRLSKGMSLMIADDVITGMYIMTELYPAQVIELDKSNGDVRIKAINSKKRLVHLCLSKQSALYGRMP